MLVDVQERRTKCRGPLLPHIDQFTSPRSVTLDNHSPPLTKANKDIGEAARKILHQSVLSKHLERKRAAHLDILSHHYQAWVSRASRCQNAHRTGTSPNVIS
jgi:hypothetical protein